MRLPSTTQIEVKASTQGCEEEALKVLQQVKARRHRWPQRPMCLPAFTYPMARHARRRGGGGVQAATAGGGERASRGCARGQRACFAGGGAPPAASSEIDAIHRVRGPCMTCAPCWSTALKPPPGLFLQNCVDMLVANAVACR